MPEGKKRLLLITFAMNGLLFLMGGLDFLDQGKTLFGTIQVVVGVANLLFLALQKRRTRKSLDQAALLLNAVVCAVVAIDYFDQEKSLLPYAWVLAGIVSLVAFVVLSFKIK